MRKKGYGVDYFPDAQIIHKISSGNAKLAPQTIIKRHKGMTYGLWVWLAIPQATPYTHENFSP